MADVKVKVAKVAVEETDAELTEPTFKHSIGILLSERLHVSTDQMQTFCVGVMQVAFGSLSLSLLAAVFIFISIAGGIRTPLTIDVLVYMSYASLGAIGLITTMIIVLNAISLGSSEL